MVAGFQWQDYLVFTAIIVVSCFIGIVIAIRNRNNRTVTSYLLANRKLRWLPVGLSILVTFQSAVVFIGVPAEIYTYGMGYILFHIGMALAVTISALVFVPLLFPLKLTSVYEYLERRYNSKFARLTGSMIGMFNMSLYMGVVIFAPATAIEAVTDFPAWFSILLIGILATIYTTLGGLKAVVWTDVSQFVVMATGMIAILIKGCLVQGGMEKVLKVSGEGERLDFFSYSADPRIRHSVWSLTIGGTLTWLANIGVNQSNVQRFSSVPTLKGAILSVFVSLPGCVIMGCISSFVGLIVYSYFSEQSCDPLKAGIIKNPNQLVPLFVITVFKESPGFAGMFVASLFCASLSTVSSSINSLAAMMYEDVIKWRVKDMKEETSTKLVKLFVVLFGMVAMAIAYVAMQLGGPATQIALVFFGASGGPLLGMFVLGAICPRANWIGVSVGAVVGLTLCLWLAIGKYSIPPYKQLPSIPGNYCHIYSDSNSSNFTYNNSLYNEDGHNPQATYTVHSIATTAGVHFNLSGEGGNISAAGTADKSILEEFYSISYLWYSMIGVCTVLIIGILVSLLTGSSTNVKKDLLLHIPSCTAKNTSPNSLQSPDHNNRTIGMPVCDSSENLPIKDNVVSDDQL